MECTIGKPKPYLFGIYMNYELFPLFPTIIYRKKLDFTLTEEELSIISSMEVMPQVLGNNLSKNTNIFDNPKLLRIKNIFMDNVQTYFHEVMKYKSELYMTNSWLNVTRPNEQHEMHNHTNSIVSGCWYYWAKDSQPTISFNRIVPPFLLNMIPNSYNEYNSIEWDLPIDDNVLVLFPSSCHHLVKPNTSSSDRVSVAFNTFVKGQIGSNEGLTYLNL
jgi:hypothetical protein